MGSSSSNTPALLANTSIRGTPRRILFVPLPPLVASPNPFSRPLTPAYTHYHHHTHSTPTRPPTLSIPQLPLHRMIAAFTSGACFSLVSSAGGANPMQAAAGQSNPLMAAFSAGVVFALFQGGFYKVGGREWCGGWECVSVWRVVFAIPAILLQGGWVGGSGVVGGSMCPCAGLFLLSQRSVYKVGGWVGGLGGCVCERGGERVSVAWCFCSSRGPSTTCVSGSGVCVCVRVAVVWCDAMTVRCRVVWMGESAVEWVGARGEGGVVWRGVGGTGVVGWWVWTCG